MYILQARNFREILKVTSSPKKPSEDGIDRKMLVSSEKCLLQRIPEVN